MKMPLYNQNSHFKTVFHRFPISEKGASPAGYAALIATYNLSVPTPDYICAIGTKHKKYDKGRWHFFTPRHKPDNSLYGHLRFALKYEGIDLAVLKALFAAIEPKTIEVISSSH